MKKPPFPSQSVSLSVTKKPLLSRIKVENGFGRGIAGTCRHHHWRRRRRRNAFVCVCFSRRQEAHIHKLTGRPWRGGGGGGVQTTQTSAVKPINQLLEALPCLLAKTDFKNSLFEKYPIYIHSCLHHHHHQQRVFEVNGNAARHPMTTTTRNQNTLIMAVVQTRANPHHPLLLLLQEGKGRATFTRILKTTLVAAQRMIPTMMTIWMMDMMRRTAAGLQRLGNGVRI